MYFKSHVQMQLYLQRLGRAGVLVGLGTLLRTIIGLPDRTENGEALIMMTMVMVSLTTPA
jgi:hypothetical protein